MMWKRRALQVAGVVLSGILVVIGSGMVFFHSLIRAVTRPSAHFDAKSLPAAPDYHDPAVWSALPNREDAADIAMAAHPGIDQRSAAADVFYIHPTTYIGRSWNGPVDDPRLNADTDRVATRLQASVWNACCAIYAPRYRQVNIAGFTEPSPDSERALEVAYFDVAAAFRHYIIQHNQGRPFFIAAHSQGSVLGERLLREEISHKPIRQKLIAAYLIGIPISAKALAKHASDIPICTTDTQTGCVLSFNARGPQYRINEFAFRRSNEDPFSAAREAVCVNPISFSADEVAVAASHNAGALFFDAKPPVLLPKFASAHCQNGTLQVALQGNPPRDFMSRLLDRAMGPDNYHAIEYQLFYVNLRHNAQARLAAFVAPR